MVYQRVIILILVINILGESMIAASQDVLTDNFDNENHQHITSCSSVNSSYSGLFNLVHPKNSSLSTIIFCEMQSFNGGWLVFQRRLNGSVDFYRNWTEYRNGFGDPTGESWLGLELLHQLTSRTPHEMIVELEDYSGKLSYARYSEFVVGSEEDRYELTRLGIYSGTTFDAMRSHEGMKFTTFDNDNDVDDEENCAIHCGGAWWYRYCYYSNLNGQYSGLIRQGLRWRTAETIDYTTMKHTRMMIRKI